MVQAIRATAATRSAVYELISRTPESSPLTSVQVFHTPSVQETEVTDRNKVAVMLSDMFRAKLIGRTGYVDPMNPSIKYAYHRRGEVDKPALKPKAKAPAAPAPTLHRPEVRVEGDRIVIEHPLCRVVVDLRPLEVRS